jgi:hypothetical protein
MPKLRLSMPPGVGLSLGKSGGIVTVRIGQTVTTVTPLQDVSDHGHHGRSYPGHVGHMTVIAFIRAGSDSTTTVKPSSSFTEAAIVRNQAP